jgi:hypothetical protein
LKRRLKLRHEYHDALVTAIEYSDGDSLGLTVSLCGGSNPTPGAIVHLTFHGVRNIQEVYERLESIQSANTLKPYDTEILGIFRNENRGYVLCLVEENLIVDAKSVTET